MTIQRTKQVTSQAKKCIPVGGHLCRSKVKETIQVFCAQDTTGKLKHTIVCWLANCLLEPCKTTVAEILLKTAENRHF